MNDAVLTIAHDSGRRTVHLSSYLDAAGEERARDSAIAWIKALRCVVVDGLPLRSRFTHKGDSLWWFTEIYLHKTAVIQSLFRGILACRRMLDEEAPRRVRIERANHLTRFVLSRLLQAQRGSLSGPALPPLFWHARLASLAARARWFQIAAHASRLRPRSSPAAGPPPVVAAFVHRAFLRDDGGDGAAEAYIGPVLTALEDRLTRRRVAFVSLGPAENFSARRWWHPLRADDQPAGAEPIERYATLDRLRESRRVWMARHRNRRTLWQSAALRERSTIDGVDCWPAVRDALAGAALLQWPWSARAMDEAGAALDALQPAVALTYAEAGGWGRALMLECRRRRIPSVGLQHGFIYRHWLNYLHEPDEIAADPRNPADGGFPRPDATLLFDDYAREHLTAAGHLPPDTLVVTGSPRLDALVRAARALDEEAIARAKQQAGAGTGLLVLVVTKYREAQGILPPLLDAAGALPDVRLAIKTHPAETPEVYAGVAAGRANVVVLPAAVPLAPLLRAARAVVTVNSTVALDAAVLGVPALVVGLPNNLSPFVQAGAMAGTGGDGIRPALERILYDEKFRQQLERVRSLFLARFRILSDGGAAERSAEAVLKLVE